MVRYIDMEEQEQEIEKQVSILDGHIEYIPVNVKIRIVSFDKISGSWKEGYAIHNIILDPIVSIKSVYLDGYMYNKIETKDGAYYYSPTELKVLQQHLEITPYKLYGDKKMSISEWVKNVGG